MISYEELVDYYIDNTEDNVRPTTGQYRYIVYYENDKQKEYIDKLTLEKKEENNLHFNIQKLDNFYVAENYHQKYQLRLSRNLYNKTLVLFDSEEELINSHLATKLNSYNSNLISKQDILDIINNYYLTPIYPEKIDDLIELIEK